MAEFINIPSQNAAKVGFNWDLWCYYRITSPYVPHTHQSQTLTITDGLRWLRPSNTTSKQDRLQQAWKVMETGEIIWKDVELFVED